MPDAIDIGDDYEAEPVDHDPFAPASVQTIAQPAGENPAPQGLGAIAQTPSSYGPAPFPNADRDAMIRTVAGEAGNQPPLGQAGIAHAIENRVADGGYGEGIQGVVHQPVKPGSKYHEFSVWNDPGVAESSAATHGITPADPNYAKIGDIVDKVHSGLIPDPTGGATHYYAPKSMAGGKPPPWAAALAKQSSHKIGDQLFLGGSQGPGQTIPRQIVGGPQDDGTGAA